MRRIYSIVVCLPLFLLTITAHSSRWDKSACSKILASEILSEKELISEQLWLPVYEDLIKKISGLTLPAAHGLTSHDFAGVVRDQALFSGNSKNGWDLEVNSLSDLRQPDGLLASYGFATRNDFSSFQIHSEPFTGRDVVDRYVDESAIVKSAPHWQRPLFNFLLRTVALRFASDRPMSKDGYPVYLVFEAEGLNLNHVRPTQIPSEMATRERVGLDRLRYVLVPALHLEKVSLLLKDLNLNNVELFPMETLELYEIKHHQSKIKSLIKPLLRRSALPLYKWLAKRVPVGSAVKSE